MQHRVTKMQNNQKVRVSDGLQHRWYLIVYQCIRIRHRLLLMYAITNSTAQE